MTVNLKSLSINEVELSGNIELPDILIQQIREVSPPNKDGNTLFYDSYKIGNDSHVGWLALSSPEKDTKTYRFFLHYQPGRVRKQKKRIPLVSEALEILSNTDNPFELSCSVTFSFKKRDKVKTILSLPLALSDSPSFPFDEVRGIHISKTEDKIRKYDAILDRGRDGSLTAAIGFPHKVTINSALISDVVNKAVEISAGLVCREK